MFLCPNSSHSMIYASGWVQVFPSIQSSLICWMPDRPTAIMWQNDTRSTWHLLKFSLNSVPKGRQHAPLLLPLTLDNFFFFSYPNLELHFNEFYFCKMSIKTKIPCWHSVFVSLCTFLCRLEQCSWIEAESFCWRLSWHVSQVTMIIRFGRQKHTHTTLKSHVPCNSDETKEYIFNV